MPNAKTGLAIAPGGPGSDGAGAFHPHALRSVGHAVLLGDSIFDNAAYVDGGPDVVHQLREVLPPGWRATLAARDGSVTVDVERQLHAVPADATHLVLSVGGNDALGYLEILEMPARSVAQVLDLLAGIREEFGDGYRRMLARVLRTELPLVVCTIYEGALPDPDMHRRAATALTVFNDVILRAALELRLAAIDLRLVCSDPSDYANPIEPSVNGGAKIAAAIARTLVESEEQRGTRPAV